MQPSDSESVVLFALVARDAQLPSAEPVDERPLPEPTGFQPGTAGKVAILEQRAMAGLELWHPSDPTAFEELKRRVPWILPEVSLEVSDA